MSHLKERAEKNCLNCNTTVAGRYCHVCGQENIEPKESFWHLINHFFQDITHFDGKFFKTLGLLISRPGFLSAEYAKGRRASYLNPVRMYVFTSAFFFFIFFTFFKVDEDSIVKNATINGKTFEEVTAMDSAAFAGYTARISKGNDQPAIPMTREQFKKYYDSVITGAPVFDAADSNYRSREEYDSLLRSGKIENGWLERRFTYQQIELNKKYNGNNRKIFTAITEGFIHKLPQLLFVSLPLFALLLQLLYIRRKQFYYVSHGIFSIHLYVFIFIAMLVSLALRKLNVQLDWAIIKYIRIAITLGVFFYIFRAMYNFYRQSTGKTIVKYLLLAVLFLVTLVLLFSFFFVFSFLTI